MGEPGMTIFGFTIFGFDGFAVTAGLGLGVILGLAFVASIRLNARLYLDGEASVLAPVAVHAARWVVLALGFYALSRLGSAALIVAIAAFTASSAAATAATLRRS